MRHSNWPLWIALIFVATLNGLVLAAEAPAVAKAPPLRLAISGFAELGEEPGLRQQSALLVDLITAELSSERVFELIERQESERAFREMSLALSQRLPPTQ